MNRIKLILVITMSAWGILAFSQNSRSHFFNSRSSGGELRLKSYYQNQKSNIGAITEDQVSLYFIGGIILRNSSYLWNQDIISFNIDVEYNPESRRETYLLIPDRSEVRTIKRLDFNTTVFQNKAITFNSFVNLNQSYYNRELLTNIKSDNRRWGGLLTFNNKILPVSVSFHQTDWRQKEQPSGREFNMVQNNIQGRVSKSFGKTDLNELIYSHDNYKYNYAGSREINNEIGKIALINNLYFDQNRKYNLNSQISQYDQAGDNPFKKSEAIERVMLTLPAGFRFTSGYNYYRLNYPTNTLVQNRISASLNHRLFESLNTTIAFEYSVTDQTVNSEKNANGLIDINYTKKIGNNRLNVSYRFARNSFDVEGVSAPVRIINEEHLLTDSRIVLLNKPYVDLPTVEIKDITGIIVYQLNFDYTLTVRNNFVEIQRIPGGLIADNQAIVADYTAVQPGSYSYESNNNSLATSLLLFHNLIELYYRGSIQTFNKTEKTDFLTINRYNQNIYGCRLDLDFGGLGAEYDNYNSNIIPYKRYRYYLNFNWRFKTRLLLSLNGDIFDYKLIEDNTNQQHINISGKIAYNLSLRTRIEAEAGYLSQRGRNIDFDLISSRLGLTSSYRQLQFKAGVDIYSRSYPGSDFVYTGAFCEVIRKF